MHVREDRKADQQKRLIGFSVCESHHDQSEVGIDARPKIAAALEAGGLSPAQMPSLMRRAQTPGIVWAFRVSVWMKR